MNQQPPRSETETEATAATAATAAAQEAGDAEKAERRANLLQLNAQIGGAVFLVLTFWLVIFSLPSEKVPQMTWQLWTLVIGAGLVGCALFWLTPLVHYPAIGAISLGCFVLLLDAMVLLGLTGVVSYTAELKFTLGVGGGALAFFAVGIIVFDTIRVAASLPIVVLFIGTVTYPAAVTAEIREQLIIWMTAILGVAAATEAVTQTAKVIAAAQVSKAVAGSVTAGPAEAGGLRRSLTPPSSEVGGDLAPSPLK